jgi:hypothetical protein
LANDLWKVADDLAADPRGQAKGGAYLSTDGRDRAEESRDRATLLGKSRLLSDEQAALPQ